MYVCLCRQVTDQDIEEAIELGHGDVESLARCLGVTTGCGQCREYTEHLVGQRQHGDAAERAA